ncbi:solute carrier family 17 member 9-like isoform X2 [Carcharodon carcharias]|uniref:solute carrier family 17 member 9-like isoform X2 n=1 Tax=Carcharodon carcharias TaxID=13397 RepID=UPI001B7F2402|nr:solute carrier family 17 member 9-like isoform X2 [Carcharodon carcharias]
MAFAVHDDGAKYSSFKHSGALQTALTTTTAHSNGKFWSKSEAKSWIAFLFLGTCLVYCVRVTLPICVPVMAEQFAWDKKQSGIVLGSFFWGYCLTQIIGGHTSDRLGGDKILLLSATSWGSVITLTPLIVHWSSTPIIFLTLSRFLMGLLQGVFFPSLTSLFSSKVRESDRAFTSSAVCAGSQVGTLIIGAVGSVLLDWYGWESVFYFSGLPSILWAYCMWKYFLKGEDQIISLENLGNNLVNSKDNKVMWRKFFGSAPVWSPGQRNEHRSEDSRRRAQSQAELETLLRAVIVAHVCISGTFFCLLSWMPTFFHDSFPESKGWVFNVIPWAVAVPFSFSGGILADRLINLGFDTAKVMAMGLSSIFIELLSYSGSYYQALICISASLGLQTFSHSGVSVNVQDLAPSCAGALFGVMNTGGALVGVILVYCAGYLIETSGSWPSVFNLISIVNVFGLSIFVIFGQAKRVDI